MIKKVITVLSLIVFLFVSQNLIFADTGTISGKVTKSDGTTALGGSQVLVFSSSTMVSSTTAATDGTYQLINISTGVYDVRCSSEPSYVSHLTSSVVVLGGSTTTVNFSLLQAKGTISGKVTKSDGTTALVGSQVLVLSGSTVVSSTTAATDGTYQLVNVSTGTYSLFVSSTGYAAYFATNVVVNPEQTTTVNVSLSTSTFLWVKQLGTSANDESRGVAIDSDKNLYVVGYTTGSLDGNISSGKKDIFLVKYTTYGDKLWTQQLGTNTDEEGWAVATDSSSNIYLTGYTNGNFYGNINSGGEDIFLVKCSSTDTIIWSRLLGTDKDEEGRNIAIDGSGNIYLTGYTNGNLDGVNAGANDIFLVKYSTNGTTLWKRQIGTVSYDYGYGVAVDTVNNVYITGLTAGNFDGNTGAGGNDIFLVKYDTDGNKLWSKQLGTVTNDEGRSVAIDGSGNVYVTGYTDGSLDGNTNLGGCDMVLVKYNSVGIKQWTRQFGTTGNDYAWGIKVDNQDNVYVTGTVEGNFANNIALGSSDILVIKYASIGVLLWSKQFGTNKNDEVRNITVDSSSNVYITGYTNGWLDGNLNFGGNDTFLIKYYVPPVSITAVTGIISGKLTKRNGVTPIVGAVIEVLQVSSVKYQVSSVADGTYQIDNVSPGVYDVRCQMTDYELLITTGVVVSTGSTTVIDFVLYLVPKLVTGSDNVVIAQNMFNPRRGQSAWVIINVSKSSKLAAKIFDISGQLVKEYPEIAISAGNYEFNWDGKNSKDETVVPGLYFMYLYTDLFKKIEKVLVTR